MAGRQHTVDASRIGTVLALAAPVSIAVAAAVYLVIMITDMSAMPGMSAMMINSQPFAPAQFIGLLVMWVVMMAAMMLPTAGPMILAFARMQTADDRKLAVLSFSLGYVFIWSFFGFAATALQALFVQLSLMSPMMMKVGNDLVAGSILVTAGAYQFTPLKNVCLQQCSTPMSFLMTEWRDGIGGALSMGLRHGVYCLGCCWALMGLLFVAGVMNPAWIAAITIYVFAEKALPAGLIISKFTGLSLIGWGLWHLI